MNPAPVPPRAVFLDRDGTIIEDRHYLADPAGVVLLPGAGEALGRLCAAGCGLFVVTNQSGIGRGYFREEDFLACQNRLEELLRPFGAAIAAVRHCPHEPSAGCACRKPGTGMWESLRAAHGLNPAECVMAGDKTEDLLFGLNAGFAASCLVLTGKGESRARELGWVLPEGRDAAECRLPERLPGMTAPGPERTRLFLLRNLDALARLLTGGAECDASRGCSPSSPR